MQDDNFGNGQNPPENPNDAGNEKDKSNEITSIEISKDKYAGEEERKKNNKRIFIITGIAFIIALILIAILLLFMFCGKKNVSDEPSPQTTETSAASKAPEAETSAEVSISSDNGSDEDDATETTAEQTTEEQPPEEVAVEDEETPDTSEETVAVAPTISIAVIEGPMYSPADGVCYYRIRATVTGTPAPVVAWSKNDTSSYGPYVAQVNLANPSESYTLTGTASNSAGSASDSITLTWGCNRPPDISDISVPPEIITGQQYPISASASDPDGDSLTYSWSVTGGSFSNSGANPTQWTAPDSSGTFNITVTVNDGNGGTDSMTRSVNVEAVNREPSLGPITVYEIGTSTSVSFAFTGQQYDLSVSASDPDGDNLSYNWSVSSITPGTLSNQTNNPALWTAPYTAAIVTISVTVDDGRGGVVKNTRDIEIRYYLY
ncbi:MAG: PKD domain-containing protein [Actinobacteria bacterium]|nr:PKD domain-containing protein [Actinomycetota bacterium]